MNRVATWLGLAVIIVLAIGFAMANAGRQVSIDFGLFALYSVPVTFVAFGGMVVGMAVVLVAGINADLKVRRLLRERHMEDRELAERGNQRLAEPGNRRLAEPGSQRLAERGSQRLAERAEPQLSGPADPQGPANRPKGETLLE